MPLIPVTGKGLERRSVFPSIRLIVVWTVEGKKEAESEADNTNRIDTIIRIGLSFLVKAELLLFW